MPEGIDRIGQRGRPAGRDGGKPKKYGENAIKRAMAQRHANSMAARHSMDHAGFFAERGPRGARAENVAWGCATESCTISIWEGSAGHRANMLMSDVHSYGMASATGGGRRYWCLDLGP
jgi:uncharacterized protein YkwD